MCGIDVCMNRLVWQYIIWYSAFLFKHLWGRIGKAHVTLKSEELDFYSWENKEKISLRNCPRSVGQSKSALDSHPGLFADLSQCAAGDENSFDFEWGKLGKFCCHLLKIKFNQVLICSFNESLVHCMCLCKLLYGLLLWGQILTTYCKIVLIYY